MQISGNMEKDPDDLNEQEEEIHKWNTPD